MATKTEKRPLEAETTGHEWDGIQEYNKPLPRWWLYVFYATIVWSIGYYVLYPSWPWVNGYLGGALGYSQRAELEATMAAVETGQGARRATIAAAGLDEIRKDPELFAFALAGGRASFNENCAACHAVGGAGRPGYPTLADDHWLWGGAAEDIHTTILYGVRAAHPETRASQMPAFGIEGMLTRQQIGDVAEQVLALAGRSTDAAAAERGASLYAENCAACHGDRGQGDASMGAPALADNIWLYGSSREAVEAQIFKPRHGMMPAWAGRLDPATVKMLAVYVHALGGGKE